MVTPGVVPWFSGVVHVLGVVLLMYVNIIPAILSQRMETPIQNHS
jgi:hypothetical protein